MSDPKSSANADGVFEPFHIDRVRWQCFEKGSRFGMRFQVPSELAGASQSEGYRGSATMGYWEGVES
jgi:hypothetical protein